MSASYGAEDNASRGLGERGARARSLSEQAQRVVADVRELGHMGMETLGESVHELKERGRDAVDTGREKVTEYRHELERMVAERPMRSLLIAAGIGAVIGYVLHRRR